MKKTDNVTTDKKIVEMDDLQGHIEKTSAMLYQVGATIRDKIREHELLTKNLDNFIRDITDHHPIIDFTTTTNHIGGRFDETRLNTAEKEQFEFLRDQVVSVEKELIDAKKQQATLQDQETSLLSNIARLNENYATECLLYIQNKQVEVEQRISTINEAMAAQQIIIEQEKSTSLPAITDAIQKHEEVLANIALGTIEKNKLDDINKQLQKAAETTSQSNKKMNDAVIIAQQTIVGLQRKLTTNQNELEVVRFARAGAEKRFLMAEAEKAGREYAAAADTLTANYRRLLALHAIMADKKYPTIESRNIFHCSIPTFALNCHQGLGDGELFQAEQASRRYYLENDINSEVERFAESGMAI